MRVDLPALGNPTKPTSASNLSSRRIHFSSPGSPFSAIDGALCMAVAKRALPLPPLPPRAMTASCPAAVKSAMVSPLSSSITNVPAGTLTTRSSPRAPCWFLPSPCCPRSALKCLRYWKSIKVLMPSSAINITFPPRPPSPPAGPPKGTYFSLRKATQPLPPSPPLTKILA